jgi:hypothetical protein
VGYVLPRSLSIRAFVAPAVASTTVSGPGGTVELRQTVAAIDVAYAFGLERARFYPLVSLGGGLYDLQYDGRATAGEVGQHGSFLTASFIGAAALGVRLLPRLALLADLQVIALGTEPVVTVGASPVGSTGRPAFLPSLGLVAHF